MTHLAIVTLTSNITNAATLGDVGLRPIKIASIASGMSWPRIFYDP